jgi:phage terminase large subunit GpA-like protein
MEKQAQLNEAFNEGLRPDPAMTISDWADAHRYLPQKSSSEPGRWRTARTPYLKEIMDCLSPNDPCEKVILQKASQIGGTEVGLNWLGYIIHLSPGPCMIVEPTLELSSRLSKQRIEPSIEESPILRSLVKEAKSRDSSNTIMQKDFRAGTLILTGANSAVGLRSMPARFLFLDEVDAYPFDIEGEGDPASLAVKRTTTFARRKIFMISKPNIKDLSRIEREFLLSDQRYYNVPCPYCGHFQNLKWSGIVWDHDENNKPIIESVKYKCEKCEMLIDEHFKTQMLEHGKWIPSNPESKTPGFHLNSLYSPLGWKNWKDILKEWYEAKGIREKLKSFINDILAETWEESSEKVESDPLIARRESYNKVPEGAFILTAGVDVQRNRLECEVVAWGLGEESWSMDYKICDGDPNQDAVWTELDEYLNSQWEHENGDKLKIACAAIDSSDNTQKVYNFVKPRQGRWIRAIKGAVKADKSFLFNKKDIRGVLLYTIGVDKIKESFYSYLRIKEKGPGYCHFPIHPMFDQEHFKQLTAEQLVTRYVRGFPTRLWEKKYERNEALDCRVYAMAALLIGNINLRKFAEVWEVKHGGTPVKEISKEPEKPKEEPKFDKYGFKNVPGKGLYRIKMIRGVVWNGSTLEKGKEYELSLKDVRELVAMKKAEALDELPSPTPSPEVNVNPFLKRKPFQKNWVNDY